MMQSILNIRMMYPKMFIQPLIEFDVWNCNEITQLCESERWEIV